MTPVTGNQLEAIRAYLLSKQNALNARSEADRLEALVRKIHMDLLDIGITEASIATIRDHLVLTGRLPRSAGEPSPANRRHYARELILEFMRQGRRLPEAITLAEIRAGIRVKYQTAYTWARAAGLKLGLVKEIRGKNQVARLRRSA